MKIFYFDNRDEPSCYWRCIIPATALRDLRFAQTAHRKDFDESVLKQGIKMFSKEYTEALISMCMWADVVVFWASHRECDIEWIRICHGLGKKVVVDCDDMFDCENQPWITNKPVYFSNVLMQRKIFNLVDGITVTTDGLKNHYSKFTKTPIYVLKNMLDLNYDRWIGIEKKKRDNLRVGYMGASFHFQDIEFMDDVFRTVLSKYNNVEFEFLGMSNNQLLKLKNDFGDRVILGAKSEKTDWLPIEQFSKLIGQFDIGIIPIIDWEFNTIGKSDIKFLEYTAANVPTVASNLRPYNESIKNNFNGLLTENNLNDWVNKLSTLIENPDLRLKLLYNAKKYVFSNRIIQRNIHKWLNVYEEVLYGSPR